MKADTKGYAKGLAFITGTFASAVYLGCSNSTVIRRFGRGCSAMRPLWILAAMGLMGGLWVI